MSPDSIPLAQLGVDRISVIDIGPDDVIVIRSENWLVEAIIDRLGKALRRALPENRTLILDGGVEMTIARPSGWIAVDDRLPEPDQDVLFVVDQPSDAWNHGRVLGGRFHRGERHWDFRTPGIAWNASHWMPSPAAPAAAPSRHESRYGGTKNGDSEPPETAIDAGESPEHDILGGMTGSASEPSGLGPKTHSADVVPNHDSYRMGNNGDSGCE